MSQYSLSIQKMNDNITLMTKLNENNSTSMEWKNFWDIENKYFICKSSIPSSLSITLYSLYYFFLSSSFDLVILVYSAHAITSELNELVKHFILVNEKQWITLHERNMLSIPRIRLMLMKYFTKISVSNISVIDSTTTMVTQYPATFMRLQSLSKMDWILVVCIFD